MPAATAPKSGTSHLVIEDISVFYGKVPAVRGASITVQPGELVAIIGPNSAGKSSLVQAVGTQSRQRRVQGTVRLGDTDVLGLSTRRRWDIGLRVVPQGREIFPSLTAEDNLRVVAENLGLDWARVAEQARRQFSRVFQERAHIPAGNLSGGEQQMLAVARALMGAPRFLLLDEPRLGLAHRIVTEMLDILRDLQQSGLGLLVADQTIDQWVQHVDRAFLLRRGQVVRSADTREAMRLMSDTQFEE